MSTPTVDRPAPVRSAVAAPHTAETSPAHEDADVLRILPPEPLSPEAGTRHPDLAPPALAGTRICPGCRKSLPGDAKICIDCGIYLDTGRAIIMTDDGSVDRVHELAEKTIRAISWIAWAGIYPIASEAFGLHKPWVVRGIAILTIAVSFAFFGAMIAGGPAWQTFEGMMLWAGDPEAVDAPAVNPQSERDRIVDPESRRRDRGYAASALPVQYESAREFHPLQLLTHTLLHGGLLHLAGNMLFLMVLGARVNALVGNLWTLALYPVLGIVAGVSHMLSLSGEPPTAMLGASGAVMGLAGMYLALFPTHRVHMAAWIRWGLLMRFRLSLKIFAVRGFWVVLFYIAFDVVYTVFGLEDNVAHWAHLGGFIAGVIIALALLCGRLIDARGGDLLSAILGRHAWKLIGRPRHAPSAARK